MDRVISLISALSIAFSISTTSVSEFKQPRIIDAFILAYDEMYKGDSGLSSKKYIILDMESLYFTDTTYEEREKAIQYFTKKYNKTVLNASLFKLQQIGLASNIGSLRIDGNLLMFTSIKPNIDGGIVAKGYNWVSPVGASEFRIMLKIIDGQWKVVESKLLGVA
ncbi:hypothetical protein [Clostridium fungisolvens]|uniref:Uncharacterized protein n=1 Tax=Clostridium fungisolvens TaxID=1604897 RepID=A0A6V8SDC2_9CLOT|nr:hypothetical protein [Clostridium fungisolvens]GFP74831.1 hypothetical protein bsdtw1_00893 [Clostridium fungisolvens]